MRKLFIFFNFMFSAGIINAQNIGIGTNSPNGSAILDITSSSKGVLIPRMTTALRTTIASPVLGLLVFDTDTKTIWTHDGSAWKNLFTSGGLSLPFSQTVNTAISAFQVTNQGLGAAIEGSSTAQFGTGITAKATGEGGWGLYAFSNGAGSQSVRSYADNGTAYHGENNNPANTNTLLNLINRGAGKTGSFQLINNSSTSANVQIAGNNLAEQLLVFQTNVSNTLPAVSISNSGSGAGLSSTGANAIGLLGTSTNNIGVSGVSTTNFGVKGVTTTANTGSAAVYGENNGTQGNGVLGVANFASGYAVKGESNFGTGVYGYSGNNRGVSGNTISGTGLYGNSLSGYGLEVVGKVKISGGNTNPSDGAVLTSDASGNAVWKTNRLAFKSFGFNDNYSSIVSDQWKRLYFANEFYDFANNFTPYPVGNSPTANSSTFAPTVEGVYHLESNVLMTVPRDATAVAYIRLRMDRNGVLSTLQEYAAVMPYQIDFFDYKFAYLKISGDFLIFNGDKIFVEVLQRSDNGAAGTLLTSSLAEYYFAGHLAIPF